MQNNQTQKTCTHASSWPERKKFQNILHTHKVIIIIRKDNYSFESGSIYMVSKSLSKSNNTHSRIIYEEDKRISLYVRVEKSVIQQSLHNNSQRHSEREMAMTKRKPEKLSHLA